MPRISSLPALTRPEANDEIAIVDASAATTKKITREDFLKGADLPNDTVTTNAIADGAVTAPKLDFATLAFGNYSTTEKDTGFKWIDGKAIYKKTLELGAFPNSSTKNVPHGITSIDKIIRIETISRDPGITYDTASIAYDASRVRVYRSGANIAVQSNFNASALSGEATIYYTKT